MAPEGLTEGRIRQVYPEMEAGRVAADVDAAGIGGLLIGERARVYLDSGERVAMVVASVYLYKRCVVDYALVKGIGEKVVPPGLSGCGRFEGWSWLKGGAGLLPP